MSTPSGRAAAGNEGIPYYEMQGFRTMVGRDVDRDSGSGVVRAAMGATFVAGTVDVTLGDLLPDVLDAYLPYGVIVSDAADAIVYANAAAGRVFGLSAARLQASALPDLFAGAQLADGAPLAWRRHPTAVCQRTGAPVGGVVASLRCARGESTWLSLDAQPLAGPGYVLTTIADVSSLMRDGAAVAAQDGYQAALRDMMGALVARLDGADLFDLLVTATAAVAHTKNGVLLVTETGGDSLVVVAGTGVHAHRVGVRMRRGEGLAGQVLAAGRPIVVDDYQSWPSRLPGRHTIVSAIGLPVIVDSVVAGVLCLSHTQPGRTFAPDAVEAGAQFARLAGRAILRLRRRATADGSEGAAE